MPQDYDGDIDLTIDDDLACTIKQGREKELT